MKVKVCGITTQQAADTVVQSGADMIGFVFTKSKRQITPQKASEIASTLPGTVKKVGIFVNESVTTIKQIADTVGLDIIQLHGEEPAEMANNLPYPIIKAFPATRDAINQLANYPCDYYLLDSPYGKKRGGNGTTFDWDLLKTKQIDHEKLILAGGLTPENVRHAITTCKPFIVDVSSGVETNGQKDAKKIMEFVCTAKGVDNHDNLSKTKS